MRCFSEGCQALRFLAARAVVRSDRASSWAWLSELRKRRPHSVAVAAVANKLAGTIWAILAKGQTWRPQTWQAA